MDDYISISLQERRKDCIASKAFKELVDHLEINQVELEPSFRRSWIRIIILDLSANCSGKTDWSNNTIWLALACLRLLGRSIIATDDLSNHLNLLTIYGKLLPSNSPKSDKSNFSPNTNSDNQHSFDLEIAQESLKILANTLFLHPLARSSKDLLPTLNSLVQLALSSSFNNLNSNSISISNPSSISISTESKDSLKFSYDTDQTSFLASRIIFLITAAQSNLVIQLIEKTSLVLDLQDNLNQLLIKKLNPQIHSISIIPPNVLIEHLKIIFNIMVNYPRSIKQFGHSSTQSINHSRFLYSVPTNHLNQQSTIDNSTHQVGNSKSQNINFCNSLHDPLLSNQSLSAFGLSSNQPAQLDCFESQTNSPKSNFDQDQELLAIVNEPENKIFAAFLPNLIKLFLVEPIPHPPNIKPPLSSYIHTFLNFSPSAHCFFDHKFKLGDDLIEDDDIPPFISKLIEIIDQFTQYYCPHNPNDPASKKKCQEDNIELDGDLTQVILLTANLISPHPSGGLTDQSRKFLRQKILPDDIERGMALSKQDNLVGRILRLLNAVGFDSLKVTAGEFLYSLFDKNADFLTSQIGYGPLAGFLLSIGQPGLNPDSIYQPPANVNPITGARWDSGETVESLDEVMTQEEKEKEAERLCDLFDRINRNGVISVKDPRKVAVETGKFEEIEKAAEMKSDELEKADEEKALRELEEYKKRKAKKQNV
ncbi:hypothetical protein O181_016701 [Austropuccinia psidii MF-1]|uniref:Uncharacterized protein n=1 Tax=Austropuccinia psidii MF-1 TaxID=1389203 RepID=A0A9Q3C274_9BASI|nr:hypothetical protein [Austropuccinia psidii MF-1]